MTAPPELCICGHLAHGRGPECCTEMVVTPSIEASEPLGPCGCGSEPDDERCPGCGHPAHAGRCFAFVTLPFKTHRSLCPCKERSKLRRRHARTVAERFWVKVEKTASCWVWRSSSVSHGYGRFDFTFDPKRVRGSSHGWRAGLPVPVRAVRRPSVRAAMA